MPSPVNNTQYVVFTNLFCLSFFNSHSQTNYKYSFSHHYVLKLFYKIFCWHWESIFIFTSFSSVNIASDLINVSKCNICKYALSKTIGSRFIFVVVLICLHLYLGIHQKIMFRRYSTYSGKNSGNSNYYYSLSFSLSLLFFLQIRFKKAIVSQMNYSNRVLLSTRLYASAFFLATPKFHVCCLEY